MEPGPSRIVPAPGQESVWDYPRPPRVEAVTKRIRIELAGVVIVDTERALRVLETANPPTYYLPQPDVRMDLLEPSTHRSVCEWKGQARYWSVRLGERVVTDAAWSYPEPTPAFAAIRDHLAFYAGKMDACYVGDARVTPQPGAFYGGWITPDVVGPFKGEPGTLHW